MRFQRPASLLAAVTLATGLAAATAAAPALADSSGLRHHDHPSHRSHAAHAVFVQNDDVTGNAVIAYHRSPSGALRQTGRYPTGGLGGALAGSVVDHLASQGSLAFDRDLLVAVNAGSNTITTFAVKGERLARLQVLPAGGTFPVSVALHGDRVFVLDARDGGAIQGYVRIGDRLALVPGWHRSLGLDPAQTPEFTSTPGQVGFTPDGRRLVVTTKNGSNDVLVYGVSRFGLAGAPTTTHLPGAVPFGFAFDSRGALVLTEAGTNSVATFRITRSGALVPLDSEATGQAATCWAVVAGRQAYVSNAGSGTLSGYRLDHGALQSAGTTATDAGTVDAATSPDGRFLYVQTGAAGMVDGFRIGPDGALTATGSVTVPGAVGGEGIVVR